MLITLPTKPLLSAWTHSEPQVSILYRSSIGNQLAEVVRFAIAGGPPPDLDYEPFHALISQKDTSGHSRRHYEKAIGWQGWPYWPAIAPR